MQFRLVGSGAAGRRAVRLLPSPAGMTAIPLTIREPAGVARSQELVTLSVPLPRGLARPADGWTAIAPDGERLPCQTRELAAWPDGSVRWLSAGFAASVAAHQSAVFRLIPSTVAIGVKSSLRVAESQECIEVHAGASSLRLRRQGDSLIEQASAGAMSPIAAELRLVDARGRSWSGSTDSLNVDES